MLDLLYDSILCESFRTFLKQNYSEENLLFFFDVEKYKKLEDKQLVNEFQRIFQTYIKSTGDLEINIDMNTKQTICKHSKTPSRTVFDKAQQEIFDLMASDSLPKFTKSEIYKQLPSIHTDYFSFDDK